MTSVDVKNWRVLVVDDEDDSTEILEQVFEIYGVEEVRTVASGVECLEVLEGFQPDLIVIDLSMPEMNGWKTLEEIRANPAQQNAFVVAITAFHSTHVAKEAQRVGFDAYFEKPIDVETFMDEVLRAMG